MARFWPSALILCLVAVLSGCSGRSLEGQWVGPLPGIASNEECRIRLYGNRGFEYACPSSQKMGVGTYTFDGELLEVTFERVAVRGRVEKDVYPSFRAKVSGQGNYLRLTILQNEAVFWKRAAL